MPKGFSNSVARYPSLNPPQNVCEYDGDWEMSSDDSDDDGLDYSTRHKTNPFLTSANRMTRYY